MEKCFQYSLFFKFFLPLTHIFSCFILQEGEKNGKNLILTVYFFIFSPSKYFYPPFPFSMGSRLEYMYTHVTKSNLGTVRKMEIQVPAALVLLVLILVNINQILAVAGKYNNTCYKIPILCQFTQEGRRHCDVYYTSPQSFIITFLVC